MTTLVITVVGDDRAGLVSALADVIDRHGGSWGRSQLAELAGRFAGIVTVEVAQGGVADLTAALEPLQGVLETTVQEASSRAAAAAERTAYRLELMGNDHPGIVREISAALAAHDVTIDALATRTVPTPETGGDTFVAEVVVRPASEADLDALRGALEDLARDLMVDITLEAETETGPEAAAETRTEGEPS